MEKMDYVMDNYVILGHQPCQTREAKFLCIDAIYEKLHRPNYYDLGGTYMQEIGEYWFVTRTDQIGEVFLIHIFITNKLEGIVSLSLSSGNTVIFDKDKNIAFLSPDLSKCDFGKLEESTFKYVTTYSFDIIEVDMLKGKQLFIPISFVDKDENASSLDAVLDFSPLLEEPIGADFTIESEDGEKFLVHKVLLMAHSEVFRAMLKEDTAESKNNCVKLIDVNKEELRHLLYFIYSGTLKDVENINFFNMLILADRFNLSGLRELSEHALIQQISIENALEMLAVADSYNSHSLKTASLIFIKKNKSALENNIFDEINNAELIRELCKFLVS
ncbi:BTB/POZ and MATH domain-containing protein 2-like [Pieris napi]|uniref:BTB/POZ and MATH domain-containing protein 2-like n=1 Tax=Pieris napi TaxID=78633 RepID=UPI001FBA271F|nr:BTB/POZ and MATH domain-containing protein 2-like [Pieris napi]